MALLKVDFYRGRLSKLSMTRSLQQAQTEMTEEIRYAHPYTGALCAGWPQCRPIKKATPESMALHYIQ